MLGSVPKTKREVREFFENAAGISQGAAASTGVSILSDSPGFTKTVLKFVNAPFPLVDAAGVVAHVGKKIFDFPEGLLVVAATSANLALTKSSAGVNADWDGDFSLGSVVADAGNALAGTEQNFLPTTATPQAVAGATTAKGVSTAQVILDGTAAAVDLYLNFLVDDADQDVTTTPCNLIVNGTVTVVWALGGDK